MNSEEIKEIFIVSCYPNVPEKERLLNETIDKLKKIGKSVLIASHFPVPDYIVKKCDHYLYDSFNMIDIYNHTLDNDGPDYWVKSDHFYVETTITHHASALSRIFGMAMEFVKTVGYNYFIIIESDSEYDINDLKKFDLYKNKLISENKKLFFFKPKFTEFNWRNETVYETYCFGGFLENFLEIFKFPISLDGWNNLIKENKYFNCFEFLLSQKFYRQSENFLILGSIKSQFVNSKIDLFTAGESSGLYYNCSNELQPVIFLNNHDHLGRSSIYDVVVNTQPIRSIQLNYGGWYFYTVDLNSENTISVSINTYRNNKLYSEYRDFLSKDNLQQKKLFKRFTFLK